MTTLDFFSIHAEPEDGFVSMNVELNFLCEDHLTIIECEGLTDDINMGGLLKTLKEFYESETECAWSVKQYYGSYKHSVCIFGSYEDPSFAFDCDRIKITEKDE